MLIGREKEIKILKENYQSDESSFLAVYGRRRIGKTYLINKAFEGKILFHHAGIYQGTLEEQIASFMESLRESGFQGEAKPKDWLEAFSCLKKLIASSDERKKVIFLDEIAWMYTKKSNFVRALEYFWNGWASARNDVMLIICSSATSWIINNIIHSKGGLYNRVTTQIYLEPFSLGECAEFCSARGLSLTHKQVIETYMVLGGVPYYWNYLSKGESIPQFIDRCFFAPNAPLKDELRYIFSSVFSSPEGYMRIIEKLSRKGYGLSKKDLLRESGEVDNGNFTRKLEDLQNCGFIRAYCPLHYRKKDVLYQLIDPFTIFHFHFLAQKQSDPFYWANQLNTPSINAWKGLAFERVCLLHGDKIKKALGVSGVSASFYPWSCRKDEEKGIYGSQIDLVLERKDLITNLFEVKFYDSAYRLGRKDIESLYRKKNDFINLVGNRSAIHLSLIALNGVEENAYAKELQFIMTGEDLFT